MRLSVGALALVLGACGDNHETVVPSTTLVCPGSEPPCVDVRFVGHQDDDLLFMNPDIAASIDAGNDVVTVYVTAGTVAYEERLAMRERGILNAYTQMIEPAAAVTDVAAEPAMLSHWRLHGGAPIELPVPGGVRHAVQYDYERPTDAGGRVSLVFLRLVEVYDGPDLQKLWRREVPDIPSVACTHGCVLGAASAAEAFSPETLIDTLDAVIARFEDPTRGLAISTLDATELFHLTEDFGSGWTDNPDHLAAARFAVSAFMRHQARPSAAPRALLQYRGYDTSEELPNHPAQTRAKRRAFDRYLALGEAPGAVDDDGTPIIYTNGDHDDPHFTGDNYEIWSARRYVVASVADRTGRLAVGDACLRVDGDALVLGPCADAPRWTNLGWRLELVDDGRCVVLDADDAARVAPCVPDADAERQTFVMTATGQLRGRGATCLHADALGVVATACDLELDDAGDPARAAIEPQRWTWLPPG